MAKLTGKAKAKFLARMKKGRKAAKKSGGAKKNNSKRTKLEKRIEDLENKLNSVLQKGAGDFAFQAEMGKDPEFQAGLKLRDELKRELESGRNG